MRNWALALSELATQQYGPLYVVCARNPLEVTPSVFMLDKGQVLQMERSALPHTPFFDLRADQEVFGFTPAVTRWSSNTYSWKNDHPAVQDGSAIRFVEQLLEANKIAAAMDIQDFWSRQAWLQHWADENLCWETWTLNVP